MKILYKKDGSVIISTRNPEAGTIEGRGHLIAEIALRLYQEGTEHTDHYFRNGDRERTFHHGLDGTE